MGAAKQILCKKGHYFSDVGRTNRGSCLLCHALNKKSRKKYLKEYVEKHQEKLAKQKHDRGQRLKVELREYKRKYRKEHPEVHRISNAKREIKRNLRTPKFGQEGIRQFYHNCPREMVVDRSEEH